MFQEACLIGEMTQAQETCGMKPDDPRGHDAQQLQRIYGPLAPFHPKEPFRSPEPSHGKDQFGDPAQSSNPENN